MLLMSDSDPDQIYEDDATYQGYLKQVQQILQDKDGFDDVNSVCLCVLSCQPFMSVCVCVCVCIKYTSEVYECR